MLLRRVIHHVGDQNWVAVGIDFIIVVFGVFMGIEVSNWNEARGIRLAEAHYLTALENDANYSLDSLKGMLTRLDQQQAARRALFDYSRTPDAPLAAPEIDSLLQEGLFSLERDDISQVAFDALSDSGQLSLIGDPVLITALQELDAAAKMIAVWRDESIKFTYESTDTFLIDNVDMQGVILVAGDADGLRWLNNVQHLENPPDALKSVKFKNLLLYKSEITRGRIGAIRTLVEHYKNVLTLIGLRQAEIGAD
jgi:hypothetical protein